jgi:hypothetical protein
MDMLGRRAIEKTLDATGQPPGPRANLQRWALLGDIAANTLYYAAVARGTGRAPKSVRLDAPDDERWYLAGALASAAAATWMSPRRSVVAA